MAGRVNLAEKLATFDEHWVPRIVGELNGQHVKLVKFQGEYVWHHHAKEDEMFLVLYGQMQLHLRDSTVELSQGEFFIVPRGVEHKPEAQNECQALLFEPATTRSTGSIDHDYTIEPGDLERL